MVAAATCATYGGIHAMQGNPTGAMGVADYLGWKWRSKAGLPIVNVPGCPVQPDNKSETLLYLLHQANGVAPLIPLDDKLRPTWLFGDTVHEGCDRGGYYEQGDFAHEYGSKKCLVKIGCWGPVVKCNVTKRGWMDGVGGCPNVGGICIACTMPGFPDKFMPLMDEPPGAIRSLQPGPAQFYKGRRVRMMPRRRADSMDLFLAGRIAKVEAIERDFEDRVYVAVSLEDDPAADMNSVYNRFYYFDPDELEPPEIQNQET